MNPARSVSVRAADRTHGVPGPQFSLLLALTLLLLGQVPFTFADQTESFPKVMKVGFSAGVFPDVDQRDAQAAMQLWTKELARGLGLKGEPQTIIYNRTEDLLAAVKKGELILVNLSALEFLGIRGKAPMSPALVSLSNIGEMRQFVLVTRRDSGFTSLRDLRNRSILMPSRRKYSVGRIWLEVLLLQDGKKNPSTFFGEMKESASASQALMSVFFKKVNAAIVTRGTLETSAAMNPQLRSQLTVLAESRSLIGDLTCIPDNVSQQVKRSIENTARHLHESTVGKQMLTMFQIDRAILFQPSHLEGLEELLKEHNRLLAKKARKG
jgi:ABC-type phosphate/phosphonate transport system substrate-binding protein